MRLDEVVLRALEKKPELRYQQASEVKTQVETIASTPPGSSRREEAQFEKSAIQGTPSKARTLRIQRLAAMWILRASVLGWGVLLFCVYGLPKFVDAWAGSGEELSPLMQFFLAVGRYRPAVLIQMSAL